MNKPSFILSPCGTSLLTHGVDSDLRSLINRHSNAKNEDEVKAVSSADHLRIQTHLLDVREKIGVADLLAAKKRSAELNGIISLYGGNFKQKRKGDFHQLLSSDTWLGEASASVVEDWLKKQGFTAEVRRQTDLRTVDLVSFQSALSDLVQWCEEEVRLYSKSHRIIFNLTGGFKSIQGFLQTLAQFYADESIYIFETGNELLRLPRLPIKMAAGEIVRKYFEAFRLLSLGFEYLSENKVGIPETLLMVIGGQVCLSPWGDLVWAQTKKEIYAEKVFPPPGNFISFGRDFEKSVAGLEGHRNIIVNERIDDLVHYFKEKHSGKAKPHNPRSLDFKSLAGNSCPPSTHECDAWHDQDAKRLFGHFNGDYFVLDRLAKALH